MHTYTRTHTLGNDDNAGKGSVQSNNSQSMLAYKSQVIGLDCSLQIGELLFIVILPIIVQTTPNESSCTQLLRYQPYANTWNASSLFYTEACMSYIHVCIQAPSESTKWKANTTNESKTMPTFQLLPEPYFLLCIKVHGTQCPTKLYA